MAADDLTKPLGLTVSRRLSGPRLVVAVVAVATAVTGVAVGALWLGREPGPTATAAINVPTSGEVELTDRTGSIATRPGAPPMPADPNAPGLTEVKPASPDGLVEVGKVIIHDPSESPPMQLAALPEQSLVEMVEYGPLPMIAADGSRPLDVYARPSAADDRDVRVAIIVGGVGIDADGTARAISELPGSVTLALAPYGDDLDRTVAAARTAGHELLLQIPLEPYGYPRTDPGPHTLLSDASPEENRDSLHWLMSRATNYVGVVNYMGARFTSQTTPLAPVLDEIGKRGLLYLDDGSSARSVAATVGAGRVPFLRADLVLDADLTASAIDARLNDLRTIARKRGYAIATATAFPLTVERVAAFAAAAADRNIVLVPVSSLSAVGGR